MNTRIAEKPNTGTRRMNALVAPLILVAFGLGCGLGTSAPDRQNGPHAVEPEPADTKVLASTDTIPPTGADFPRACDGNGPMDGQVEHTTVAEGPDIHILQCAFYAYQGEYEVWITNGANTTHALSLVGFPVVSGRTVRNIQKYRGPGDCGIYQVWDITSDGLSLRETRERSCDAPHLGDDDDIMPDTWPLVLAEGHCSAETAFFSCPVDGGKTVSLCGSSDGSVLQYRFGPIGSPELSFPSDSSPTVFRYEHQNYVRGYRTAVSFDVDGYTYSVEEQLEGGSMTGPPPTNFEGVIVHQEGKEVLRLACTEVATSALESLGDTLDTLIP